MRWAVLNVAALLRRHAALQDALASLMASGASVGACVARIESHFLQAGGGSDEDLLPPGEQGGASFVSSQSASSAEATQQEA